MAIEDYIEPEVAVAVAVTAAICSPQVRGILRKGAVYGLAGLMMASDAVAGFAASFGRNVRGVADEAIADADEPVQKPRPTRRKAEAN